MDDTNVICSLAGQLPRCASVKSGNLIANAAIAQSFFSSCVHEVQLYEQKAVNTTRPI